MNDCDEVSIDDLVSRLRLEFPDALPGMISTILRDVAHRFFKETDAANEWIVEDAQSCQDAYVIELDDCWMVNNILCVDVNGCPYRPNHRKLGQCNSYWKKKNTLYLSDAPMEDCPGGLKIWISKYPKLTACDGPLMCPDEYADWLIEGARSRMYGLKGEEWHDKTLMQIHYNFYAQGKAEAIDNVDYDEVRGHSVHERRDRRGGYI